jgi:hypothetical protein
MPRRIGLVPWTRVVSSVLLAAQAAGCSSWRVEQVSPEQLLRDRAPAEVRVARADGTQLILGGPRISGDSLTGVNGGIPRGVPLGDISTIATRHGEAGKSVLLGLGLILGVVAIAYAANPPCYFACQ